MPRSNVGQVAHVSPTPWVTSQEADTTRRALEVACWLQLGYWSNNSVNRHASRSALNRRVLRACLVPQCSYPPHRPRHQLRLANWDWMPAPYTIVQLFNPRRHPTCWASSQWSHTLSGTPCRGAWTSALLNAHPSFECKCMSPQIETLICARRTSHQSIWQQHTCCAVGGSLMECGVDGTTPQNSSFSYPTPAPAHTHTVLTLPRRAWVRLNRLRTGVGHLRSCLCKWGMA